MNLLVGIFTPRTDEPFLFHFFSSLLPPLAVVVLCPLYRYCAPPCGCRNGQFIVYICPSFEIIRSLNFFFSLCCKLQ